MSAVFDDPRVTHDAYVVRPTGYDEMVHSDKDMWCLRVVDGHAWGWSVRRRYGDHEAMNRKGEWIYEQRGSRSNRFRRFTLEEALTLALRYVDSQSINGHTAAEASASVARRNGDAE